MVINELEEPIVPVLSLSLSDQVIGFVHQYTVCYAVILVKQHQPYHLYNLLLR